MTVSGIAMDRHSSSKPIHRYSMSTDRKDIVGHEALHDRHSLHPNSIAHAYLCTAFKETHPSNGCARVKRRYAKGVISYILEGRWKLSPIRS